MRKQAKPTWFITGCSSGLGRQLALSALQAGFNAVITARRPETIKDIVDAHPDSALAARLDVTSPTQITTAVEQALERFGSVDVLVNNAGHGYRAAVEEGDSVEVDALFASNFFGPVSLIKALLPGMRARKSGAIINVSSIAGRLAAPGSGYYSATKFALEGLSDALRKELDPLGIKVMVVDPGAFRTDFAGRSLKQARELIDDYTGTAGPRRKENDNSHGTQPGDPVRAAKAILTAISAESPPFRLLLGRDAIEIVSKELAAQFLEIDDWKQLSSSTDYQDGH